MYLHKTISKLKSQEAASSSSNSSKRQKLDSSDRTADFEIDTISIEAIAGEGILQ